MEKIEHNLLLQNQAPPLQIIHTKKQMATLYQLLAILNTRRYTEAEIAELSTCLENTTMDEVKMLFMIVADKDSAVNEVARREGRYLDIQRRWESLLMILRRAYDSLKLKEGKGPWILSSEHVLDITYRHYRRMSMIFHSPVQSV